MSVCLQGVLSMSQAMSMASSGAVQFWDVCFPKTPIHFTQCSIHKMPASIHIDHRLSIPIVLVSSQSFHSFLALGFLCAFFVSWKPRLLGKLSVHSTFPHGRAQKQMRSEISINPAESFPQGCLPIHLGFATAVRYFIYCSDKMFKGIIKQRTRYVLYTRRCSVKDAAPNAQCKMLVAFIMSWMENMFYCIPE